MWVVDDAVLLRSGDGERKWSGWGKEWKIRNVEECVIGENAYVKVDRVIVIGDGWISGWKESGRINRDGNAKRDKGVR
jgi:hypothetical protein